MARVLISMPEEFLNMIDNIADSEQRSRSELIREALRTYIHKARIRRKHPRKQKCDNIRSLTGLM